MDLGNTAVSTRTRSQTSLVRRTDEEREEREEREVFRITLRSSLRGLHGLLISIPRWTEMQTTDDDESDLTYEDSNESTASVTDVDVPTVNLDKIAVTVINKSNCPTEECVICLEPFKLRQHCRSLRCNHFFHKKCADRWIKRNPHCPICRQPVQLLRPVAAPDRILRPR